MSFLNEYFEEWDDTKEKAVLCPFPHHTSSGIEYEESNPSAHINTLEKLFHCKACKRGFNELQFIQEVLQCDYAQARKLQIVFENEEDIDAWDTEGVLSEATKQRALALGISEQVIQELKIKTPPPPDKDNVILFPVFMYNHLVDIRRYNPGGKPKIKSRFNAISGHIIPFDIWRQTELKSTTLICAGEKDMAVARTHGFNAITLTGGERALPLALSEFKDRNVVIVYDNDDAGHEGAIGLATNLYQVTHNIKVCTAFHSVCNQKGEDITDFFVKYGKTRTDLINFIKETAIFEPSTEEQKEQANILPVVTLYEASQPAFINRMVQTNIQVVATSEQTFIAPAAAVLEKFQLADKKTNTLNVGDVRSWELAPADILKLVDGTLKENDIKDNIKTLVKIPFTEPYVSIKILNKVTVYKAFVTDLYETGSDTMQPMEYLCYSIGNRLESGKKYQVTHMLTPHPTKGGQLTMVAIATNEANDTVSSFTITDSVITNLKTIQEMPGTTVANKMQHIVSKVKGILGYNGNNQLIEVIDLAYHTVLRFNFGSFTNVRGYLDTLVVGESRVGKSSTAEALRDTYGLGMFVSLSGNSATVAGLIGGSNKTTTGFQTRAGLIPQNHKGLIIFEELGKSNTNIIKELTDIRSSNEVRIARVSGSITLPALVRMISLSNVKDNNKTPKPIAAYPNGISVIVELVPTAEDVARYDLILILGDRGNSNVNPLWIPDAPFNTDVYRDRIRWIWSRTPEQIIISDTVKQNIINKANELNAIYDSHLKIFGTETWKKVTRLAIAIAGYLVSTDTTYENIIVETAHVNYAAELLVRLYDNDTFRLKEYVARERQYSTTDADATVALQDIYNKSPALIQTLEQYAAVTKNMLQASTGLSNEDLNRQLNRLTRSLFVRIDNFEIQPTERFRLTLRNITRNTHIASLGEVTEVNVLNVDINNNNH